MEEVFKIEIISPEKILFADDAKRMFATFLSADLREEVQVGTESLDCVLLQEIQQC